MNTVNPRNVRFLGELAIASALSSTGIFLAVEFGFDDQGIGIALFPLVRALLITVPWWLVLRRYFDWAGSWLFGSTVGTYTGILARHALLANISFSTVFGRTEYPFPLDAPAPGQWDEWILGNLLASAGLGVSWGLSEWLSIRRHRPFSIWWVPTRLTELVLLDSLFILVPAGGSGLLAQAGIVAAVGLMGGMLTAYLWMRFFGIRVRPQMGQSR